MTSKGPKKTATAETVRVGQRVSYVRTFPGAWPRVLEAIEAFVERRSDGWGAGGHLSLPIESREQWNVWRHFDSREEAARFAAAFVAESERILAALAAGEQPWMPHRAMRTACADALDRDPKLLELERRILHAPTGERGRLRSELAGARSEATLTWFRVNDFRDFLRPTAMQGAA